MIQGWKSPMGTRPLPLSNLAPNSLYCWKTSDLWFPGADGPEEHQGVRELDYVALFSYGPFSSSLTP